MDYVPIHFFDQPITVRFAVDPARQKTPPCPDGFTWDGREYRVAEKLSEWFDYSRRGKSARNMQPEHAAAASRRGSLGVGRFYFRVRVTTDGGEGGRVFDLYYDRQVRSADDRLGHWFLYRELGPGANPDRGERA
jgi:hypothetical protein